jgi:pyrroline-5-carboxylate reductase
MNKIGFIGFGNMGGTMLRALLRTGAIPEDRVIVFTRTLQKLKEFAASHREVEIAKSLPDLGLKCKRVFICTGTTEVNLVLRELAGCLCGDAHVITITGTIEMKCIEKVFNGRVTKILPTMISEVGEGVTLVLHNDKVLPEDKEFIRSAFEAIGKVMEFKENQLDLAADLTSCAPGFYACILRNMLEAGMLHSDLSPEEVKELVIATAYGTAK